MGETIKQASAVGLTALLGLGLECVSCLFKGLCAVAEVRSGSTKGASEVFCEVVEGGSYA